MCVCNTNNISTNQSWLVGSKLKILCTRQRNSINYAIYWMKQRTYCVTFTLFYVTLTQTKVMFLSSSVRDNDKERFSCVLASVLNHSGNLRGSSNIITHHAFSCKATQQDSIFITVDFFRASEKLSRRIIVHDEWHPKQRTFIF